MTTVASQQLMLDSVPSRLLASSYEQVELDA